MMRGMRNINPKQMERMMKQMGISTEEISAEEVIIRTRDKEYRFQNPAVNVITAQGQKTFQIMGDHEVISRTKTDTGDEVKEKAKATTVAIPDEDVKLVAQQANVSEDEARKALEDCRGNPAEAIVKLTG